jgi:SAM-dependent methyltransferase
MTEAKQDFKDICESINTYYSEKIGEFGATARGVDWRDETSQELRFEQLVYVLGPATLVQLQGDNCTVLDYGCGYGAFLTFLRNRGFKAHYVGFDFSQAMIDAAREQHAQDRNAIFSTSQPQEHVDFAFASGIFNVRLDNDEKAFRDYIFSILDGLNDMSTQGFSFNMLTDSSDKQYMRNDLHYEDPGEILCHCMERYSRTVNIFHGYRLFEFTVGVLKGPESIGIRR